MYVDQLLRPNWDNSLFHRPLACMKEIPEMTPKDTFVADF